MRHTRPDLLTCYIEPDDRQMSKTRSAPFSSLVMTYLVGLAGLSRWFSLLLSSGNPRVPLCALPSRALASPRREPRTSTFPDRPLASLRASPYLLPSLSVSPACPCVVSMLVSLAGLRTSMPHSSLSSINEARRLVVATPRSTRGRPPRLPQMAGLAPAGPRLGRRSTLYREHIPSLAVEGFEG